MNRPAPAHAGRAAKLLLVGTAAVTAVVIAFLCHQYAASAASSLATAFADEPSDAAADGVLPGGVTVFDDHYPGVAHLDPELRAALDSASAAAAAAGIEVRINTGWRSPDYQNALLRDAVATYGSAEEAARWVATADTSAHVAGDAVDVGPYDAAAWLSAHGAVFGLCQIYANEPWHFELRPAAVETGCDPLYADPTEDPRMHG